VRPFRERNPIAVGLVSIAVLSVAMLFAFSLDRLTFLRGVYLIEADFADASGLTPDNEVRVAGLRVGKVRDIRLVGPDDLQALPGAPRAQGAAKVDRVRVTMEIEDGVRLGNATTGEIKLKTLLGAKFVDLRPRGGAPFLMDGGLIPLDRTSIPFEIYEIINRTVEQFGRLDSDALNEALRKLAAVTEDPDGNLGRALDGLAEATAALSERDAELDSLLQGSDTLLAALATRSEELGRIIDSSSRVLGVLEERRQNVRRFVRGTDQVARELSSLLRSTRGSLDPALKDLHAVLEVVSRNYDPLEEVVRTLGPGAESFGRIFTQGTWGDVWLQSLIVPLPTLPSPPVP